MWNQMRNPWGGAHTVSYYDPDRKIVHVTTASHGGIGVDHTLDLPACLAGLGESDGNRRWFEEDEAWAAVAVAFPKFFSPSRVELAKETLKQYHPKAYMAFFNETLGPADSKRLEQLAWEDATRSKFTVLSSWGDWAWDIPLGHVYARGFRALDECTAGFLVPSEQYVNPARLVLDGFPRWEPERTVPYTKAPLAAHVA